MRQRQTLFYRIAGFGLLGLALLGSDAMAQTAVPKADNAPVSSEPGTTIAGYGDWVLRCQRVGAQGKTMRVCEVAEMIQVQGQNAPIAQVAIGRMARGEPLRLTAAVPPAVTFPSAVRIVAEKEGRALDLEWRRCLPGGCFADVPVKDDLLKRWRGLTEPGRLTFKDASGREVSLPLSFRGLAQALDALAKEGH